MNTIEEGAKAAGSFINSLRREPLSLALVVMNLALLIIFWFILDRVADHRTKEVALMYQAQKEMRELFARCVVPWPPLILISEKVM